MYKSCDLPGTAQVLRLLGQVQVPGYPVGIWIGDQVPLPPPKVLGEAEDGGACVRVLWITLPRR